MKAELIDETGESDEVKLCIFEESAQHSDLRAPISKRLKDAKAIIRIKKDTGEVLGIDLKRGEDSIDGIIKSINAPVPDSLERWDTTTYALIILSNPDYYVKDYNTERQQPDKNCIIRFPMFRDILSHSDDSLSAQDESQTEATEPASKRIDTQEKVQSPEDKAIEILRKIHDSMESNESQNGISFLVMPYLSITGKIGHMVPLVLSSKSKDHAIYFEFSKEGDRKSRKITGKEGIVGFTQIELTVSDKGESDCTFWTQAFLGFVAEDNESFRTMMEEINKCISNDCKRNKATKYLGRLIEKYKATLESTGIATRKPKEVDGKTPEDSGQTKFSGQPEKFGLSALGTCSTYSSRIGLQPQSLPSVHNGNVRDK